MWWCAVSGNISIIDRRWMLAWLLALMSSACVLREPPRPALLTRDQQVILAVVTWNVHAGRGDLPRFLDDLAHGHLTGAPVRDYAVLLQENIAGSQYDAVAVARQRQAWAYFAPVRQSSRGISGNAIITTQMPIEARTIDLPRVRRVRKAVAMEFDIAGSSLFIVNAHLENRTSWLQGALFSDSARRRQTEALLRALPPGPGVVGGDLNTWLGEEEPALRALAERFEDTPPGTEQPTPTFRDKLVLDHLFFDLPAGWEAVWRVVPDRYGSDHNPVIGLIMLSGQRS